MNCPYCASAYFATVDDRRVYECDTEIHESGTEDRSFACLQNENASLRKRVKRLEEAGDYWIPRDSDAQEAWAKAKEVAL